MKTDVPGQILFLILLWIFTDISILTLAGILLMFGSYWIYHGNMINSVIIYTLADVGWLTNAIQQDDKFGAISVFVGILTGIAVMYKMGTGIFEKTIVRKDLKMSKVQGIESIENILKNKFRGIEIVYDSDNQFSAEVRNWGTWKLPDGCEDEDDYDWEILTDEYKNKLDLILKNLKDYYPNFNIDGNVEEKNWICFTVESKDNVA